MGNQYFVRLNWLSLNLQYSKLVEGMVWSSVFGVVLDHLWWRRNEYTFQQKWITNASHIVNIKALVHNFYNSKIVQLSLKMDGVSDMYCASTNKRHGSVTLNCDGAMSSEAMVASCGVF